MRRLLGYGVISPWKTDDDRRQSQDQPARWLYRTREEAVRAARKGQQVIEVWSNEPPKSED